MTERQKEEERKRVATLASGVVVNGGGATMRAMRPIQEAALVNRW